MNTPHNAPCSRFLYHRLSQELLVFQLYLFCQKPQPPEYIFAELYDTYVQMLHAYPDPPRQMEIKTLILQDALAEFCREIIVKIERETTTAHDMVLALSFKCDQFKHENLLLLIHFKIAMGEYFPED